MIYAATGHRPSKLGNEWNMDGPISGQIAREFRRILERDKPDGMITGMALGVDMIWAMVGLYLKIPLTCALPCREQWKVWPEKTQQLWNSIMSGATNKIYVHDGPYYNGCMQKRNIWMVDNCGALVSVWDGSSRGGTYNCLNYAQNIGRRIILVDKAVFSRIVE